MNNNYKENSVSIAEHFSLYSYVGQRIRERRKLLKMSQGQLAEMMGFSYQQMQKYETGASQVSVSKMLQFAKILNVPATYFYEGAKLDDEIGKAIPTDIIQKSRTNPLNVLLVEDSPADVILFRKALSACSEQVDLNVIHDSESVSDFLHNHQTKYGKPMPDLVILDLSMPKITGLQLLKSIKINSETVILPVLILTNSVSKKEMQEAYRLGAAGFIQKSVDMEQFMETIEITMSYWSKAVALPTM